jgi:nucleoside-diphosphate-sugar epimerase
MVERISPPDVTVVTGAAGWLGRGLVHHLTRAEGPSTRSGVVRALVTSGVDAAALATHPRVEPVVGDIRRPDGLSALFADVHGTFDVIHAAGVIHPARVDDFEEVNARGTKNLMTAARAGGARRVVHVSSNSPFGVNAHAADTFRNDEPYHPYSGYGRSKMRAELHVLDAVEAGLDAVIVRPPWFYGPFQPARQTAFFRMVRTGRFPVIGDGRQRRSMVYIDNLVQGVVAAELTATPAGRAWWIADARPYAVAEIVATVGRALAAEGFAVTPNRVRLPAAVGRLAERADALIQRTGRYVQAVHVLGEMDKTIACDISVARAELGYAPDVELEEGMRRSVRWCVEQGLSL